MASVSIQFHATVEEIAEFVEEWMTSHLIHAAAVEYQPFSAFQVGISDLRPNLMREGVNRVLFSENAPNCTAMGNNELLDKNSGALLLDIGRLGPRGLSESRLSTTNATPIWRKIASHLKRNTNAGVIGTNEQTGASARYANHRYTKGAKLLHDNGTTLRPFAQSPVVLAPAT